MVLEAKRHIGKIDRELRKAFPTSLGVTKKPGESTFEKGIAVASLPRGTAIREVILADGHGMTKVSTPSGTYCILGRRPGTATEENDRAAFTTTTCIAYLRSSRPEKAEESISRA